MRREQLDALGVCGGSCTADADNDGICDDVDPCVGQLDECGVCNGPGAVLECGCTDIPAGDCDCDGNQLDALGVCGGSCSADADNDGICDDVDPCVGELDAIGVCNEDCTADADGGICGDSTPAWDNWTSAAFVTGPVRSWNVAVQTSRQATAIATATNSTPLVCAAEPAPQTQF